jgi:hypothetical protein
MAYSGLAVDCLLEDETMDDEARPEEVVTLLVELGLVVPVVAVLVEAVLEEDR